MKVDLKIKKLVGGAVFFLPILRGKSVVFRRQNDKL
jgi:hypothetical protein